MDPYEKLSYFENKLKERESRLLTTLETIDKLISSRDDLYRETKILKQDVELCKTAISQYEDFLKKFKTKEQEILAAIPAVEF